MPVRCIKEFHSRYFTEEDYGKLGVTYTVTENHHNPISGRLLYYKLAELHGVGWVNAERFEPA